MDILCVVLIIHTTYVDISSLSYNDHHIILDILPKVCFTFVGSHNSCISHSQHREVRKQYSYSKLFLLDGKFILLISLLNFALLPCTEKSDDL